MNNELNIRTEPIDDFILLLEVMKQMDLPGRVDRQVPRHWAQKGLSWGWTATIWLAHSVSQGDHRQLTVRDWVRQAQATWEHVTGLSIRETDFTDDRLGLVLKHLSDAQCWQALEQDLGQHLVRVYRLERQTVRVDATTVSGYHIGGQESLWQYGYSKDDPQLRQVKAMMGTLEPLGLPLALDVVSGEKADDRLYVPLIRRVLACLKEKGLLVVGDSKMSALSTRAYLHQAEQYYLTPLALVGDTATALPGWIQAAPEPLTQVYDPDGQQVIAQGYAFERSCSAEVEGETLNWQEQVLMVRSTAQAETLQRNLETRLNTPQTALLALTPPRGRGQRQIVDEAALQTAASAILSKYRVAGLLTYQYERQVEPQVNFVGPGRGAAHRPQQVTERVRYQVTAVSRNQASIAALTATFGWRPYVTDAPLTQLSFADAVWSYRHEYRIERGFGRLKGAPLSISPLFVKRDDQVVGLTHLLSLAVRLLSLIEFVVRRALRDKAQYLTGLHLENPRKATDKPTTERILRAFTRITLTLIHLPDRLIYHVTPLTPLQEHSLILLGLSPGIYTSLAREIPIIARLSRE